jgi:hypothetical protein
MEEAMSIQNFDRILQREVVARRRGRIYLTGLFVAAGVVVASLFTAM